MSAQLHDTHRLEACTTDREADGGECIKVYRLLIGGRLAPGAATLNVLNPATEEILAVAPRADRSQLDQAVAAARRSFPSLGGDTDTQTRGIAGETGWRQEDGNRTRARRRFLPCMR